MVTSYLASSNTGVNPTGPSVTLPASIPANSLAYVFLEASSADAVLSGFTGWTVVDGPRQAGNSVAMGWLLSKAVGASDSSTTASGTLTTTGTPRWAIGCVVVTGGTQSTLTYGIDATVDTSLTGPAYTPTVNNADVLVMAGITAAAGQGHLTVTTQPTGFTKLLDTGSSFGTSVELNVWAAKKTLTGQSGVSQAAPVATTDKTSRANIWVLTFSPVASSTTPTFVGGGAVALTASATTATIAYPTGIQAGDVGVLIGCYNGGSFTPTTPAGWAAQGAAHAYSTSMSLQAYTRTMDGTETGSLALSWPLAAKTAWTLSVWRGAQLAGLVYADAASDTVTTVSVPAVATPSGTAVFSTSWFERSSTPDTAVTVPAGTTLTGSAFGTGAGASSAAVARNATADSDGSVGSGVWTRSPGNTAGAVAATVAFYGSATAPPSVNVWFVKQTDGSLKAQSVTYA